MADNSNSEQNEPNEELDLLSDLQRLRQERAAEAASAEGEPDVSEDVLAKLDDIAAAAETLRQDGRVPARSAQSNRGQELEGFLRDSLDAVRNDEPADSDEPADEELPARASAPPAKPPVASPFAPFSAPQPQAAPTAEATSAPAFQVPGLFSAAEDASATAPRPAAAPLAGSLLFQAPDPEQAVVPDYDEDDDEDAADEDYGEDEDEDGVDDSADDASDDGSGEDSSGDDDSGDDDSGDDDSGRRRRRRGGRGRRRRGRDESGEDQPAAEDATGDSDAPKKRSGPEETPSADDSDDESEEDGQGGSRRRRRRRRPAESSSQPSDEVQMIKGSTRLEAKRQRRREGREAGRRRQSITEAEFLARRESVERQMIVRQENDRTQIAVLEDDVCVEHYMSESSQQASLIGNVYLGKVQNVLPSMEAAFIDIGKGRNAVLYAGEVNWDTLGTKGEPRRIELALSSGDPVLVQVTKDPVGHKGARLTSQISLPGRFLVFVPGSSMTGISRKLPDNERARLKKILKAVVPSDSGVIVRTAAEGASEEDLKQDVHRLTKRWESIQKKSTSTKVTAPQLLYSEPDMTLRIVRDVFNEDFGSLVIQGEKAWKEISEYVEAVAPDLVDRMSRYEDDEDVFDRYRVSEMIAKAMNRKVNLPSGGSLVIDRTEAMTVIDVNTGKFTGSGGNLEETVTRNNLEAAEEVIRQLRLRDIGGIIVIDFIDMVLESNRDLVVRRLVECLGRDRTRHQVAEVTSLGLVQMTRKRIGTGLAESFASAGEDLSGRGLLLPGTENDGGGKQYKSRKDRGRKDRGSQQKGQKQEDTAEEKKPTVEASRQAVAAIAKATLKSDHEKDEPQTGAPAQPASAEESSPEQEPQGRTEQKSRRGGRRGGRRPERSADQASSEEAASTAAPDEAQAEAAPAAKRPEEAGTTPAPKKQPPAAAESAPAEDAPLMIGLGAATRIQEAAPAPAKAQPRRRRKSEAEQKPAEQAAAQEPAPPVLLLGMGEE